MENLFSVVMLFTARLPLVILASTTSASENLLYAVSGLRVGSLEFGRLLQIEVRLTSTCSLATHFLIQI